MGPTPQTLPGIIRHWSTTRGAQRFCTFLRRGTAETITFADLAARSRGYARALRSRGVRPGETVIVILPHSPHLFYAFCGALAAGAVASFMAFPSPKQDRARYVADHAKLFARIRPRAVVTDDASAAALREALDALGIAIVLADEALLHADADEAGAIEPDEAAIAVLQHSSGTTGLKKGVMLTHRAIFTHARALNAALGITERDCIASWLPLYHDMGFVACFLGSLINGTHLVALDPFEWVARPALLFDAIEAHAATLCWLPNFAFSHLARTVPAQRRWNLRSVRAFINCSEPCKPATFARFAERFVDSGVTPEQLTVSYAMAENVFGVTQTPLGAPARVLRVDGEAFLAGRIIACGDGEDARALLSCGLPLPGVEIAIRAPDGLPAATGMVGEIHLRSPFLFSGYDKLPERTAAVLRDGWYASGDLGFIDDGELFVTGRVDDMIVVNGRNYYAHEIEELVNELPGVVPGRAVAFATENATADATGVTVALEIAPDADERALVRLVKERVFDSLTLALGSVHIVPRGALFKTTSGKIDRERNQRAYAPTPAAIPVEESV